MGGEQAKLAIEYQNLKEKKHHGAAKSLNVLTTQHPYILQGPSQPDPAMHSHGYRQLLSWVPHLILKDAIRTGCKGLLEVTALCADRL